MNNLPDQPPLARPLAGVELGGTKCICTLATAPDTILDQRTIPTTRPEETLPAILAILREWDNQGGFSALGLASFGPVDINPVSPGYGHVLATPKPGWPDADIVGTLAGGFDVPARFDTDVNGAALAEMLWGSGRGLRDFAYVTVGTGVGVGLIVHGAPTRGIGHSEVGHIRVPRLAGDSFVSTCPYHPDCVEGLAAGPALAARLTGRSLADVGPDDPVWLPVIDALAGMAHALVCSTGPLRIAMGGGVLVGQPHLLPRINAALLESLNGYMVLPDSVPYIVKPELGGQAGPLGAIALAAIALKGALI
ncbi:ROK family protein [Sphingobium sp. WCS2017Hpa-17]|uniref:ROK family protein n=1 Tax=Sphingobium sp. WCS2017Hpa-17 TaxID=3073638 RepID=UPI002889F388|nr:ROK family protein [Sphingobium sp. WCS2017Hpa-17]